MNHEHKFVHDVSPSNWGEKFWFWTRRSATMLNCTRSPRLMTKVFWHKFKSACCIVCQPWNKQTLPIFVVIFLLSNWIVSDISVQVILFDIDCVIFYTNLQELICQFISWTNWVNSGKSMYNCWISCQVMADLEIFLRQSHNY